MGFWDFFWLMFWSFVFVMYLMLLIQIFRDLFRDQTLSGWSKALWTIGLIVLPYLIALIYVIARDVEWVSARLTRSVRLRPKGIGISGP